MKLDFILLADMANVDAAGKINIVGEFNMLISPQTPSPPVNMVLVMRIIAAASEGPSHRFSMAVVDQDGRQLARLPEQEVQFAPSVPGTSGDMRAQIIFGLGGVQLPRYGPYSFHVLVDGRFLGERTVYVVAPPAPPTPTAPPASPAA